MLIAAVYEALGYRWATSLLAFLTVPMLPFPYVFTLYCQQQYLKN